MKKNFMTKMKKIVAVALAATISISTLEPALVTYATADAKTVLNKENFKFEYCVTSEWDNHINAMITITNTSKETIDNWAVKYKINGDIENIWNATVFDKTESNYIIKNAIWNQDIEAGESVSFGYTLYTEENVVPTEVEIISEESVVADLYYDVDYSVSNVWENGCIAEININNCGSDVIEDWILEFDYENEITNITGGVILEHTNNHYVIKNPSYSQNIAVGAKANIQIVAELGNADIKITNVILKEVKTETIYAEENYGIELDKSQFYLDEATGCYYINSTCTELKGTIYSVGNVSKAYIIVTSGSGKAVLERDIEAKSNFKVHNAGLLIGDNVITVTVEYQDGYIAQEKVIVTNYFEDNMLYLDIDFSDVDGDGLNGFLEELYETNPNDVDTDKDGISDYDELVVLGLSPILFDTDENGVSDCYEDVDNDGLTNLEEVYYGTNNCAVDSDGDLLKDYEEIKEYNTNPNDKDSDKDGAEDYWEIQNGYNPNLYNETFVVNRISEGYLTSVEVALEVEGEYANTFNVNVYENDVFINSTIDGYLGEAYTFEVEDGFTKATMKYTFDKDFLTIKDFQPTIYYFNEETQCLEEVKTNWDGVSNYVTAELNHFSTYCLLNKTSYANSFVKDYEILGNAQEKTNLNVVFALDVSSSMWIDKNILAQEAIVSFIDSLDENDQAALITFTDYAEVRFELSADKTEMREKLTTATYLGFGTTAIYKAIEKAIGMLGQNDGRKDIIIVITDGMDEPKTDFETNYEELVYEALDIDASIYSIGIGDANDILGLLAAYTDGEYYNIITATEIVEQMNMLKYKAMRRNADKNGDGIADVYLEYIINGDILLKTGSSLGIDMLSYELLQENADYDQDGLKNGEEINVIEVDGELYVDYISDPTEPDTDGDGMSDYDEVKILKTNPLEYNIAISDMDTLNNTNRYLSSALSDTYLNDYEYKAQLYLGNLIYNSEIAYVNAYKKTLYEYIELMNKVIVEEETFVVMKEDAIGNLDEVTEFLYQWSGLILEAPIDTLKKQEYNRLINGYIQEIAELKNQFRFVNSVSDVEGKIDYVISQKTKIYADYMTIQTQYYREFSEVSDFVLTGKLAEKLGGYMYKLPSNYKKWLRTFDKFTEIGDFLMVGMDVSGDVYNSVTVLSAVYAQDIQYDLALEMVNTIAHNTDNLCMMMAAQDIELALTDDYYKYVSNAWMIFDDVVKGGVEALKVYVSISSGAFGIITSLGLGISDCIYNIGEVDELSVKTIALGDAATSISKAVDKGLEKDSNMYYTVNEKNLNRTKILVQLRVVAENSFAYTASKRGYIVRLILKDQDDIEEIVFENVFNIRDIAIKYNLPLNIYYEGRYEELY